MNKIQTKLNLLRAQTSERLNTFAQFVVDVIYDRRRQGRLAELLANFLYLLSHIFHAIVRLRWYLYENRYLRNKPLGCLVVVVGNLTVGGTGKTPVVEKFARTLRDRGRKVAILSRGYKSKSEPLFKKFWRKFTHGTAEPP